MNKTLIIIPARGNSKQIPQKNLKFLNGKPLIYYAIQNSKSIKNADIYVSTDSERISAVAEILNIPSIQRPQILADDVATIDEVVYHGLKVLEKNNNPYDIVITLQPTSPLLKPDSLLSAYEYFLKNNFDTLISAKKSTHLYWQKNKGEFNPLYKTRVNRQLLDPIYKENGAFVICKAVNIRKNKTRIGDHISIYSLNSDESIDIDTANDWVLAENILKRKNIGFVTAGSHKIGLGHIYRCLTLSSNLSNHNTFFFSPEKARLGIKKMKGLNYKINEFKTNEDLLAKLLAKKIDIVINDFLDTDEKYIELLKKNKFFIVNFEDIGTGASHCDLLFNALYEWSGNNKNEFFGYRYECLREDIYHFKIKTVVSKKLEKLMIGFGGTDVNNATLKILRFLSEIVPPDIEILLILGVGYKYEKELNQYLKTSPVHNQITIKKNVLLMAEHINNSDLVISGNGRMTYEVVSLAVPLIVCSQNEREMSHIFPTICSGITYLGNINHLDAKTFTKHFNKYLNQKFREKINTDLLPYAFAIRKGVHRIVNLINGKYFEKSMYEN